MQFMEFILIKYTCVVSLCTIGLVQSFIMVQNHFVFGAKIPKGLNAKKNSKRSLVQYIDDCYNTSIILFPYMDSIFLKHFLIIKKHILHNINAGQSKKGQRIWRVWNIWSIRRIIHFDLSKRRYQAIKVHNGNVVGVWHVRSFFNIWF